MAASVNLEGARRVINRTSCFFYKMRHFTRWFSLRMREIQFPRTSVWKIFCWRMPPPEASSDHWSFHLYLSQCHLLHDLRSLQRVIHRRNRETTRRPIPRTPSWRRERRQKRMMNNRSKSNIWQTYGLSLHQGSTESRKVLEQKFIFQIGTLNPHGINERFSFN